MGYRLDCWVKCDECGDYEYGDYPVKQARRQVQEQYGFKYVKVENGSYWDLCARCAKRIKEEKQIKEK